ncbi:hypothetical protein [Dyadobacter sp. CY356]|uniref:hypothetical protein n=1 Tax=Dyadobacter sp. CY356 TaxID=2906442 RepID=UPI001F4095AB|nr:hypothetical protein [Dyadobacter sp. CY356]MCF0059844.1 hypothetical protein [Dyadobacter sp. CY356]
MMGELINAIEDIAPFQLARLRGKRVELSSRDKKQLLTKVAEIEEILNQVGKKIEVKNI